MEKSKTSFVFFTEWRHLIADLSPEVKIEIYEGISDYAETGVVPDMSPVAAAVFPFIKKEIDGKHKQIDEISQKRRNARDKRNKTENADNTQQNSTKSDFVSVCKQKTENADNTQQNSKDEKVPFNGFPLNNPLSLISEKEEKKEIKENTPYGVLKKKEKSGLKILEIPSPPGSAPPPSPKLKRSVFAKPTIEEVKAYFAEKGLKSDPEHFYDHFESNGWKVSGKSTMKDWKAAARNWERNDSRFNYGRKEQQRFGNTKPGDFTGKGFTDI